MNHVTANSIKFFALFVRLEGGPMW